MWHAAVVLLLVAPEDPQPVRFASPDLWLALKEVSAAAGLVGPHEQWAHDFRDEVNYLRQNWRELRAAPDLGDAQRLPPHRVACQRVAFNCEYQEHLQASQAAFPYRWDDLERILSESRSLGSAWEAIEKATNPRNSWVARRHALQALRDELGEEAYYAGWWPPWVPVWRFQSVN